MLITVIFKHFYLDLIIFVDVLPSSCNGNIIKMRPWASTDSVVVSVRQTIVRFCDTDF